MTSQITRDAEHLSAAQRAMREVKTEADANAWTNLHYETVKRFDPAEADSMHRTIVERLTGMGAG